MNDERAAEGDDGNNSNGSGSAPQMEPVPAALMAAWAEGQRAALAALHLTNAAAETDFRVHVGLGVSLCNDSGTGEVCVSTASAELFSPTPHELAALAGALLIAACIAARREELGGGH